jgi:hypothetical protein
VQNGRRSGFFTFNECLVFENIYINDWKLFVQSAFTLGGDQLLEVNTFFEKN